MPPAPLPGQPEAPESVSRPSFSWSGADREKPSLLQFFGYVKCWGEAPSQTVAEGFRGLCAALQHLGPAFSTPEDIFPLLLEGGSEGKGEGNIDVTKKQRLAASHTHPDHGLSSNPLSHTGQ